MPDTMRYRLDVDNRELLLSRLREELGIDKERWRSDVIDAALIHTARSIKNMNQLRGEVDPTVLQQLSTPVVSVKYRTMLETRPVGTDQYKP